MKKLTVKLTPTSQDTALRSGDFFLMPEAPYPPAITSDLPNNIRQKTYIKEFIDGVPDYEDLKPVFGVYYIKARTELEMIIVAQDPSQVDMDRIGDDSNLTYAWYKNGAPLVGPNSLFNGKGSRGLRIPPAEVTEEASGIYTCEVTNAYGTTSTTPVEISIVDPKKHPLMYKNLIQNGSGTGGVDKWTVDGGIISRTFQNNAWMSYHFGSLPPFSYYDFNAEKTGPNPEHDFRFDQGGHGGLFFNVFNTWLKKNKDLFKKDAPGNSNEIDGGWLTWYVRTFPPQIVANEDAGSFKRAAFFPGINWLDKYNRNENPKLISLTGEVEDRTLTYLTRDKIKFQTKGGAAEANLVQTLNLEKAAGFIDNTVLGVQPLVGQFFSYVGAGITGYLIKVTLPGEIEKQTFNWYVRDSEEFFAKLKFGVVSQTSSDSSTPPQTYIEIEEGSDIEIIPLVQDETTITITLKDASQKELSQIVYDGPNAADVFAIKEKAQLPLTWYPIFDLLLTNRNTIKIFGQKYSSTDALQPLMAPNSSIETKQIVDISFKLKVQKLSGAGALRAKFKDIVMDYMPAKEIGKGFVPITRQDLEAIINSKGTWSLELKVADMKRSGAWWEGFSSTIDRNDPQFDIIRKRDVYRYVARLLEAISDNITVLVLETPIIRVVSGNNEDYPIDKSDTTDMDHNAAFFIKKVAYKEGGQYFPKQAMNNEPYNFASINDKRTFKALQDYGAAAMFAIGGEFLIPESTRVAEIKVTFKHESEAFRDEQPEARGWKKDTIYRTDFGSKAADSRRVLEYGYPRCGITMTKFLMFPANERPNNSFVSYFIPPISETVWGRNKRQLYQNVHDTSAPGDFSYDFYMPTNVPSFAGIGVYELGTYTQTAERIVVQGRKNLGPQISSIDSDKFAEDVQLSEGSTPETEDNYGDETDVANAPDAGVTQASGDITNPTGSTAP